MNPEKLHVKFTNIEAQPEELVLPRRYTLTHSDTTGDLFLTISPEYDTDQISGWYTRLMRDEVLAEWISAHGGYQLHLYCHVSGGIVLGPAGWRFKIFRQHLPMVLQALRWGDRELVRAFPELDQSPVQVNFSARQDKYRRVEAWGLFEHFQIKSQANALNYAGTGE